MRAGRASWTAEGVTFYRALESARLETERGCYDPVAKEFLDTEFGLLYRNRLGRKIALLYLEHGSFAVSYFFVVSRTGYIDDCLKACIADGIRQLVILGAGFDTRAYRFGAMKDGVKVFEVDHPATQGVKLARVDRMLGRRPAYVTYVPVDFEREKMERRLLDSGYDPGVKTLFLWEGVSSYLTAEAVDETLAFVAGNTGEESSIVFTYAYMTPGTGAVWDGARKWQVAVLKIRGEPPIFGIEQGAVEAFLAERGFDLVEDISGQALAEKYVRSADTRRKPNMYNAVALATVRAMHPGGARDA